MAEVFFFFLNSKMVKDVTAFWLKLMHNVEDGGCVPYLPEINLQRGQHFIPSHLWVALHFQLLWQSAHLLAGNSVSFCSYRCRQSMLAMFVLWWFDLNDMTWLEIQLVSTQSTLHPLSASTANEKQKGLLDYWCKVYVAYVKTRTTHTCPELRQANWTGQDRFF